MAGRKRKLRKPTPGFGPYIRKMRRFKFPDTTIQEFADSLSITGPYLSHLELGTAPPPSAELLKALSARLEIDLDVLKSLAGLGPRVFPSYLSPDTYLSIEPMQQSFPMMNLTIHPEEITKYLGELILRVSVLIHEQKIPVEMLKEMISPMEILNLVLYSPLLSLKKARAETFNEIILPHGYICKQEPPNRDNAKKENTNRKE